MVNKDKIPHKYDDIITKGYNVPFQAQKKTSLAYESGLV